MFGERGKIGRPSKGKRALIVNKPKIGGLMPFSVSGKKTVNLWDEREAENAGILPTDHDFFEFPAEIWISSWVYNENEPATRSLSIRRDGYSRYPCGFSGSFPDWLAKAVSGNREGGERLTGNMNYLYFSHQTDDCSSSIVSIASSTIKGYLHFLDPADVY